MPLIDLSGTDLTKPIVSLLDKIDKAAGALYEPRKIRKLTDAKADAAITETKAEIEIADLRQRAEHRRIRENFKEQQNIENIVRKTLPHLNEEANPDGVENDWVANFFDKSRKVSNNEMQNLWARVLGGEANSPGTFSRRTVNFLEDIDQRDAKLFTNLCGFVWGVPHLVPLIFDETAEIYSKNGINFETLSHLDDIGLIQFVTGITQMQLGLPKKPAISYYGKRLILEMPNDPNHQLTIGKARLTRIGTELAPIAGSRSVDGFYDYVKNQWRSTLPWSDEIFSRNRVLSELRDVCSWHGQILENKWNGLCIVFARSGYKYIQHILPQSVSLAEAQKNLLARIEKTKNSDSENMVIRIHFGNTPITIPNEIQCDEVEFNSQDEWVRCGLLYINLRMSQTLVTCTLLHPEGLLDPKSITQKVHDYLNSKFSLAD